MGIIDRLKQRRQQKRKIKELSEFASVFHTIQQLSDGGMLHWDEKQRRLFIEQPLAQLMMTSADRWQNFIQNLYLYTYYMESQRAWNTYMLNEELAAVRHATTTAAGTLKLSREDIERIRSHRRAEIAASDMQPPKVVGFEFFIVSAAAVTTASPSSVKSGATPPPVISSGVEKSRLLAVGYFDPETDTIEMAPWDEIKIHIE